MMFTEEQEQLINHAFEYATWAHLGQTDDNGDAYIGHPVAVANILMCVTNDANLIAAAALHDTIEDTQVTYQDLVKDFGQDIADLVHEVTHEGTKEKGYYFPRLKTQRGIMLKFADRLHNLSRMETWDENRKSQYLKKSRFWNEILSDTSIYKK